MISLRMEGKPTNNPTKTPNQTMKTQQTPATLCDTPSASEFPLPAYDWNKQTRHDTIVAGKHTFNSVQTFDSQGKPKDTTNDNND